MAAAEGSTINIIVYATKLTCNWTALRSKVKVLVEPIVYDTVPVNLTRAVRKYEAGQRSRKPNIRSSGCVLKTGNAAA